MTRLALIHRSLAFGDQRHLFTCTSKEGEKRSLARRQAAFYSQVVGQEYTFFNSAEESRTPYGLLQFVELNSGEHRGVTNLILTVHWVQGEIPVRP